MKNLKLDICKKTLNKYFPLRKNSKENSFNLILNLGYIINIPQDEKLEGKILTVYYDFLDGIYFMHKNKKTIKFVSSKTHEFSTLQIHNNLNQVQIRHPKDDFIYDKNYFKYAITFKISDKYLIPIKFNHFFYEKGYTLKENEIKDFSSDNKYRWFFYLKFPKTLLIYFNNEIHISTDDIDDFIITSKTLDKFNNNTQQYEFTTLCMRYYNSRFNKSALENFKFEIININLNDANFESNITCPHCLENFINLKKNKKRLKIIEDLYPDSI